MCSTDIYDGPRVSDTKTFIQKSRWVHRNRPIEYEYDKSTYTQSLSHITITCPVHGDFIQRACDHLNGRGCRECSNERLSTGKDGFIQKANSIYADKYNYSQVEYRNTDTHVKIICPTHGEFLKTPAKHLNGQGCPSCTQKRMGDSLRRSTEDFIKISNQVHGAGRYDYSNSSYSGAHSKVTIICPIHGIFSKTAHNHINGQGCPECAITNRSYSTIDEYKMKNTDAILYHVRITRRDGTAFDKIGITKRSVEERFVRLQSLGFTYEIIETYPSDMLTCFNMEQEILSEAQIHRFKIKDLRNTCVGGWTECFPTGKVTIGKTG